MADLLAYTQGGILRQAQQGYFSVMSDTVVRHRVTTSIDDFLRVNRYYTFAGKTITMRAAVGATGQTTVIPDHHGTPVWQVSQSTNRATRQYTDPFGATRGAVAGDADADGRLDGPSPQWVGDHGYLDKPEDGSGLTAVGARMYDPVLGRFISVDPIMDLTDPQQWNAYSYANNMPVTMSDPTGLKAYAHDGSSGYTPPVQEALPKDRSVRSGRGVAAQAPTAGRPGSYRPQRPTSTSYGSYGGTGGGWSAGVCTTASSCGVGIAAGTISATHSWGSEVRRDLPPPVKTVGLSLDADDAFRNGPNYWNSYQTKIGASRGSAVGSGVSEVFDMSRGAGFRTASKLAPGVGLVMTGYASYDEGDGDWGKTAAYWGVDLAAIGAGAAAGAALGSVIPGAGTLVGGLVGALVVGAAGFVTSELIASYGHDRINQNWGRPLDEWEMW